MFLSRRANLASHQASDTCRQGRELRRKRAAFLACRQASQVTFKLGEKELERVGEFTYLGRTLSSDDSDFAALRKNMAKARTRWANVSKVLKADGAPRKARAMFYKAVVQTVLLFGSETWVLTTPMKKLLDGFHHRVARQISGLTPYYTGHGEWYYPPREDALRECGLHPMAEYISRRRRYLVQHVANHPLLECLVEADRPPGRKILWPDQLSWASTDE